MNRVLVTGRLRGAPELRRTTSGAPFGAFRVAAAGKDGAGLLCSCLAFSTHSIEALQRLRDGDRVAVSGDGAQSGSIRQGLKVTAHLVLIATHVERRRKRKGSGTWAEGVAFLSTPNGVQHGH